MIALSNLAYRYKAIPVLAIDDFRLESGRHAVVVGPSGCGKSTLLHLLAAVLRPQDGSLQVDGVELKTLTPRAADAWRGATVGFLPQRLALVPSLTVAANVALADYANGRAPDAQRVAALLGKLGLADKAAAWPHQLSGGQRQRVAIARAVFNRPRLLLADEPTANLDDDASTAVLALLRTQADEAGASLVIATHDARVLAALPQAAVLRLAAHVPAMQGAFHA